MTSLRRPRSLLLYSGTFHTGVISVADKQSWVPLFSLNLILCGHFQTYWKHVFGGVPSAGFCYIDLPRSASLALVCGACGLLSWLCCYERCHFQHFCCVKASFFASGFFFLRIMFSKGLRLCQYYKVTYFLPLACLDVVSTALEK